MQGETYQGLLLHTGYTQSVLGKMADNLQGKLLLIQGMLDPYFQPAGAFQLVDALVKENKDFDLVLLPNGGHAWDTNRYGLRRIWDYLVKHLLEIEPPSEFRLKGGFELAVESLNLESD